MRAEDPTRPSLAIFPTDVVKHMLKFLSPTDQCRARRTCKDFFNAVRMQQLKLCDFTLLSAIHENRLQLHPFTRFTKVVLIWKDRPSWYTPIDPAFRFQISLQNSHHTACFDTLREIEVNGDVTLLLNGSTFLYLETLVMDRAGATRGGIHLNHSSLPALRSVRALGNGEVALVDSHLPALRSVFADGRGPPNGVGHKNVELSGAKNMNLAEATFVATGLATISLRIHPQVRYEMYHGREDEPRRGIYECTFRADRSQAMNGLPGNITIHNVGGGVPDSWVTPEPPAPEPWA